MTKRKLKKTLREIEKVRDAWCAEFVKLRNQIKIIAEKA